MGSKSYNLKKKKKGAPHKFVYIGTLLKNMFWIEKDIHAVSGRALKNTLADGILV